MAGKITNIGREHIGELIQIGIDSAGSVSNVLDFLEIGTGVIDINITGVSDISVDGDERSFNSSSTDFVAAGITIGTVITTSGFTDANNNGDFEVLAVSTNKLIIKNNTSLVAEALGSTIAISGYLVTATDSSVKTALATGGRIALDSGYPNIDQSGSETTMIVKATYSAGSFTTGTAITEAVWTNSTGTVVAGRVILDQSKNPTELEPLSVIVEFPVVAN